MPDGVAVLQPDGSDVRGVVRFTERSDPYGYEGVTIQYRITGLTDGEHGFHIHRYGDLTDGCTSACEHFDPQTQLLESKLAEWVDALDLLTGGGGGFDAGQERVIYVGRSRFPHSEKQILKQISKISNQLSRRHHGGLDTRVRHFGDLGNITSSDGVAEGELFLAKGILDNSRYGILGRMIIVHADRDDLGEGGDEESLETGNAGKRLACGVIGLADPDTDTMTMDAEDDWDDFKDPTDSDSFREGWAAEDNYEATYGKEQAKIRRRLKNKLMGEATMGTKAGQWSARKSQELKRRYEAACERKGIKPYKGSKTTKQKDLSDWSKQGWRTASGRKSSVTGEPYFPTKAVKALKDKELYAKAKRQKAAATRAGKQRATYSKDIQTVVARYRAEDGTIDDLDSDSLVNRMDAIGILLDEIVQKHGGSYEKAERDPIYLRLVGEHTALARAYARREGFGAESDRFSAESNDAVMAFRYMPEIAYHKALEKGYMEPHGYHGATLATLDPTPTFYQTDGWYDSGHPLSDIYQIDLTGLQYRHHQVSAPQGQVILIEGDIPVDQIQPISYSYANDGFDAESDPVSSVAAGTTDALNDFANSQDTDDKFYFLGGLVGGLAIAVLGNIISDRLQDVYFPHWWENRGGSQS